MARNSTKPVVKSVASTLAQRGNTHGEFSVNAQIAQDLKDILRQSPGWDSLSADKKEALDMIMHKSARICTGNPDEPDHWHDIAGYSTLAENRCVQPE